MQTALTLALRDFVNSRPGFDPYNYSTAASYRSDTRRAQQDRTDALRLLDYVERHHGNYTDPAEYLADACRDAFMGRLSWDAETGQLNYCTGQYYPTEYRAAACAVLSLAVYRSWITDATMAGQEMTRDKARQIANRRWGRRLARWFN